MGILRESVVLSCAGWCQIATGALGKLLNLQVTLTTSADPVASPTSTLVHDRQYAAVRDAHCFFTVPVSGPVFRKSGDDAHHYEGECKCLTVLQVEQ